MNISYLPNDFCSLMKTANITNDNIFSIMHLNIRSLNNKLDSLKQLLNSLYLPFQIIGLTEMWLNEHRGKTSAHIRRKNKLYKKFLCHPTSNNENKYKVYKNKLNHIIKITKKKHYEEKLVKYKN